MRTVSRDPDATSAGVGFLECRRVGALALACVLAACRADMTGVGAPGPATAERETGWGAAPIRELVASRDGERLIARDDAERLVVVDARTLSGARVLRAGHSEDAAAEREFARESGGRAPVGDPDAVVTATWIAPDGDAVAWREESERGVVAFVVDARDGRSRRIDAPVSAVQFVDDPELAWGAEDGRVARGGRTRGAWTEIVARGGARVASLVATSTAPRTTFVVERGRHGDRRVALEPAAGETDAWDVVEVLAGTTTHDGALLVARAHLAEPDIAEPGLLAPGFALPTAVVARLVATRLVATPGFDTHEARAIVVLDPPDGPAARVAHVVAATIAAHGACVALTRTDGVVELHRPLLAGDGAPVALAPLAGLAFDARARFVAGVDVHGAAAVHDTWDGARLESFAVPEPDEVTAVALAPEGDVLYVGTANGRVLRVGLGR